jgi:uncharacterized repeat protein (TIGR03803 family)
MKRVVDTLEKLNRGKRASAVLLLCAVTTIILPAQTFTTLHSFDGTDGGEPETALVQATDGNLYGTTTFLGDGANCTPAVYPNGCGTIFKITPSGTFATLHNFCSRTDCADGAYPYGGLVQAANGDLYGTTEEGGAYGRGTVFKITPAGKLTTLYDFCSQSRCVDGEYPVSIGGLIQATNGYLYGTTLGGGAGNGGGTVFKISPGGALTTLYSFCSQTGCMDGEVPLAGLVQAANGDLYGTTSGGGANCATTPGCGTVYKMTPGGALTTLHSFCSESGCPDGLVPDAGLIQAASGDLYGTTSGGGANGNYGTVFKITPNGNLTTLYSFCAQSGCTDGYSPIYAGLIQATDGDLYGTTSGGGANGNYGTIFKITPNGNLTTLYSFCAESGCTDGSAPSAGVTQDTNGRLYGTTGLGGAHSCMFGGGNSSCGTIFRLSVGLGPFVETRPVSGEAGAFVEILGSDLTGATSVSFNGTAAAFTVVSRYLITATAPAGASTGKVEVVTPGATLSSNVAFRVP